jgi:hypothetical protein
MSIQTTKQYRVKFSDELVKPARFDIKKSTLNSNDNNNSLKKQSYINIPSHSVIEDRVIEIPIVHCKNNDLYIDEDSRVKTSSTFERYNQSYGRSSFKKRSSKSKHNYHSNSFENLNINDSDNEFKSDFLISGIIPLKKSPAIQKGSWQKPVYVQEPPIITRIPVQVINSTNTYQPQKVYKSNFIIREHNEEKYNTNSSKNIKINDFSTINDNYNNKYEENYIEIPITRISEKSNNNNYASESLAHIENLNSCVSISVIFELNHKK